MKKSTLFFVAVISIVTSIAYAQEERAVQQLFHSKRNYDVYYQASDEVVQVVNDVELRQLADGNF